jgi:1,4-alpha-glucan branching enzyme
MAEDRQLKAYRMKDIREGGAGFYIQWDADFLHPVRGVLTAPRD